MPIKWKLKWAYVRHKVLQSIKRILARNNLLDYPDLKKLNPYQC